MSVLGAVLAGGKSSRFGSDKALALLQGAPLIDHARAALGRFCETVIVVGREPGIPDRPAPHMGPLGGLAGALHHARGAGYTEVLTCGVDSVNLPADLLDRLGAAPAHLESQPIVGLWPVAALAELDAFLASDTRHSVRAFAARIGARAVKLAIDPANVNTREDLAHLERHHGL